MEPLAQLVAVATLLPLVAGLVCYVVRNSVIRTLVVLVTAIALIGVSLLLLQNGPFDYTPPPLFGVEWNSIIAVADFALLIVFLGLGLYLRNVLVTLFALAQIGIVGYFEFMSGAHVEVEPALFVDELSIIMALVISIVGSLICVYALQYMKDHEEHKHLTSSRQPRFFLYLVLFLGAMNALVFANNLLWLYFFWEVTTLCSFMLIRHDLTEESIANATKALWMNSLGGVAFAAGIVMTWQGAHTLSLKEIIQSGPNAAILMPLALLVFAGFTKSAQMPFQSWLLGAMVAPTPVSALLHSSTMVKAGVYLVVRLAPAYVGTNLSMAIALAGAFTFLLTAMLAVSQSNAKRVLAYSTISNLGLIIACAGLNTPLALSAAIMLIIFHAISKALLFLCTGIIEHKIGSRDIEDMQGLIGRLPVTTTITVVGILTMLLPPFAVLISKWAAIEASVKQPWITLIFILGSAVTVLFWVKWIGKLLGAPASAVGGKAERLETLYLTPLVLLAGMAVLLSALVAPVVDAVVEHAVMPYYNKVGGMVAAGPDLSTGVGFITIWPLFLVLLIVVLPVYLFVRVRAEEIRPAYMCGEQVGDISTVEFRSLQDKSEPVVTTSYYFEKALGEKNLNGWANPAAIALLVALLGVVVLR